MQRNLLICISIIFLFTGCSYQLINPEQTTVYVEIFSNHTLQPEIDLYLLKNLKKTITRSPGFILASSKSSADIIISGIIEEFSRNPEFISKSDQIIMASYRVKILLNIEKNHQIMKRNIDQIYSLELATEFKKDYLLDQLSNKISQDIYFQLLQLNEK